MRDKGVPGRGTPSGSHPPCHWISSLRVQKIKYNSNNNHHVWASLGSLGLVTTFLLSKKKIDLPPASRSPGPVRVRPISLSQTNRVQGLASPELPQCVWHMCGSGYHKLMKNKLLMKCWVICSSASGWSLPQSVGIFSLISTGIGSGLILPDQTPEQMAVLSYLLLWFAGLILPCFF